MEKLTLKQIAGYLERIKNNESITKNSKEHLENLLYDYFDVQTEIYRKDIRITGKIWKTYKYPKKEITEEWIISRFTMYEKHCNDYVSHYENLSKIIKSDLKITQSMYLSSYGIGIDNFHTKEQKESIRNFLKTKNINYSESISQAGYITRFNISRSRENIKKLKNL